MDIKIRLVENSLYTTDEEKQKLMDDRHALATSLLYNFFGFLSLYRTKLKPVLKEYKTNEKPLVMGMIGDDNLDPSLCVKLMLDAHYLPSSVCNQLMKLLRDIKQNKIIKSEELDQVLVKELFTLCKFDTTNKPFSILMPIVNAYLDGDINLAFLAQELYRKSRLPDIQPYCKEFRYYFMHGQYLIIYQSLVKGDDHHEDGVPIQFVDDKTKIKHVYTKPKKDDITTAVPNVKVDKHKEKHSKFKDFTIGNTNESYEYLLPALHFFNDSKPNSLPNTEYNKLFENKELFNKAMFNNFKQRIGQRETNFNTDDVRKVYNLNNLKTVVNGDIFEFDNNYKTDDYKNLLNIFKNYKVILSAKNVKLADDNSKVNYNSLLVDVANRQGHMKDFILNMSHNIHDSDESMFSINDGKFVKKKAGQYNRDIHDIQSYMNDIKRKNSMSVDDYIEMNEELPLSLQDSNITNDYDTFKYSFYNKWYLDSMEESQIQMAVLAENFQVNESFEDGFYNETVYECRNGTQNNYDFNVLTKIKDKKQEFLQRIYEDNQKFLKAKYGNNTIRLYRGLSNIDDPSHYIPAAVESWTNDIESAMDFADGDKSYIFAIDVPVEYILANYESIGTSFEVTFPDEKEFLLLGGALQKVSLMYDTPNAAYDTLVENNQQKYSDIIDSTAFDVNVRVGMGNDPYEIIIKNKVRGI